MLLLTVVYKIGTLDPSMTFSLSIYNARAKVIHSFFSLEVTWGLLKQLMRLSIIYCYIMCWLSIYRSSFSSYNFLVGCVMAK